MILCRVERPAVATVKDPQLANYKILVVQPVELDRETPKGSSFLAIDRVRAGEGDLVLVINEGSSARLAFQNNDIPLTAFIAAVVDNIELADEAALIGCSVAEQTSKGDSQ